MIDAHSNMNLHACRSCPEPGPALAFTSGPVGGLPESPSTSHFPATFQLLALYGEASHVTAEGANLKFTANWIGQLPRGFNWEWVIADRAGAFVANGTGMEPSAKVPFGAYHAGLRMLNETGQVMVSAVGSVGTVLQESGEDRCLPVAASQGSLAPLCLGLDFPVPDGAEFVTAFGVATEYRDEFNGEIQLRNEAGGHVASGGSLGRWMPGYDDWFQLGYEVQPNDPPGEWNVRWAPKNAVLGTMGFHVIVAAHPRDVPRVLSEWLAVER